MSSVRLLLGDCLVKSKELGSNSVDSVVGDPPYGLSFMGKKWDYDVPSVDVWREVLRVLKPGGHALVACGTRTQHRMAVNLEDAGFEIRDIVAWVYGSGFPKSLNIGKAVDKLQGNEREIGKLKFKGGTQLGLINDDNWKPKDVYEDKGNSPYEGWGTALKPAMELWTLCRKPLSEKTVAENVLKYGTGGINIDGCRVGTDILKEHTSGNIPNDRGEWGLKEGYVMPEREGRFPANLIHDGSDEVVGLFPNDSQRFFYTPKASKSERNAGLEGFEEKFTPASEFRPNHMEKTLEGENGNPYGRWTPTKNNHPTVKPVKLMQYLCRLITPKGGTVLDPFMGSGSTGIGAVKEGFSFIGIEMDPDYMKIAEARINNAVNK